MFPIKDVLVSPFKLMETICLRKDFCNSNLCSFPLHIVGITAFQVFWLDSETKIIIVLDDNFGTCWMYCMLSTI